MTISEIAIEGKLCQLAKEYVDDQCCQELILFLGRHPRTRFSHLAIVHALNGHRFYTERAIVRLVNNRVVRRYVENNISFYSLSSGE